MEILKVTTGPGRTIAAVTPGAVVMIDCDDNTLITRLWECLNGGGTFDEAISELGFGHSPAESIPGFALAVVEGRFLRVGLRGRFRACDRQGRVLGTGEGANTWNEAFIDRLSYLTIDDATERVSHGEFPIVSGITLISCVSLTLNVNSESATPVNTPVVSVEATSATPADAADTSATATSGGVRHIVAGGEAEGENTCGLSGNSGGVNEGVVGGSAAGGPTAGEVSVSSDTSSSSASQLEETRLPLEEPELASIVQDNFFIDSVPGNFGGRENAQVESSAAVEFPFVADSAATDNDVNPRGVVASELHTSTVEPSTSTIGPHDRPLVEEKLLSDGQEETPSATLPESRTVLHPHVRSEDEVHGEASGAAVKDLGGNASKIDVDPMGTGELSLADLRRGLNVQPPPRSLSLPSPEINLGVGNIPCDDESVSEEKAEENSVGSASFEAMHVVFDSEDGEKTVAEEEEESRVPSAVPVLPEVLVSPELSGSSAVPVEASVSDEPVGSDSTLVGSDSPASLVSTSAVPIDSASAGTSARVPVTHEVTEAAAALPQTSVTRASMELSSAHSTVDSVESLATAEYPVPSADTQSSIPSSTCAESSSASVLSTLSTPSAPSMDSSSSRTSAVPVSPGDFSVQDEDDAGETVIASRAAELRAQIADMPPQALVWGLMCPGGHVNPQAVPLCGSCGAPLRGQPGWYQRPILGEVWVSTGLNIPLDADIVIGRKPSSSTSMDRPRAHLVPVPSPEQHISRTHCEIRIENWDVLLIDRDSNNGTFVSRSGGSPIQVHPAQPFPLQVGDVISIGEGITLHMCGPRRAGQ